LSEALEVIKSEILKRSQAEAQEIISKAEKKAEEIVSSAKKKAEGLLATSLKPEVAVMRKRILGSARLEGRKMLLQAKDEAISKVFKSVEDRLKRIANGEDPEHDYEELVFKLLEEAALKIGESKLVVTSNEKTIAHLKENLRRLESKLKETLGFKVDLRIENDPYDCVGGVVVYTPEKTKIFYNSLEGRLLGLKSVLRGEVAKILFG